MRRFIFGLAFVRYLSDVFVDFDGAEQKTLSKNNIISGGNSFLFNA